MKKLQTILLILCIGLTAGAQKTKNNIGIRPLSINTNGLGMGFQFEHYLDSERYFSIVLPIDILFLENSSSNYSRNEVESSLGFTGNPSLRFYFKKPTNTNWYLSFGPYASYISSSINGNFSGIVSSSRTTIGSMTNMGFKTTINKKISIGAEFGIGLGVFNKNSYEYTNGIKVTDPNKIEMLSNLNVQLGYNF